MPRRRRKASASAASPPWVDLPPELLRDVYGRFVYAEDLVRFPTVCKPWLDAVAADRPRRFPPWEDLPVEALRNIFSRLHAASDLVRYHAVCRKWNTASDGDGEGDLPGCLLPWLLAPPSSSEDDQPCRCVFSKATYRAPGICVGGDRRVAYADGTAAWLVGDKEKKTFLANPLTAERLADLPDGDWWRDWRHRVVSGDYDCFLVYDDFNPRRRFRAWFQHPSFGRWLRVSSDTIRTDRCCAAASHHGGYVVCVDLVNCHVLRPNPEQEEENEYNYFNTTREVRAPLPEEPAGKVRRCSYLLEYCGDLLLASVLRDRRAGGRLSVTLHELCLNGGEEPEVEWVRRDRSGFDMSLLDHDVLFLGFPNSFAMEAAEFSGEVSGGTAYH
ncbi:unnamed protein product [Urochloa humidicola]